MHLCQYKIVIKAMRNVALGCLYLWRQMRVISELERGITSTSVSRFIWQPMAVSYQNYIIACPA